MSGLLLAAVLAAAAPPAPKTPTEILRDLHTEYDERFPTAAVYWGVGAALSVTGAVTLALSPSPSTHPSDRLGIYSGTATLVSGLSSCFSALPLSLSHARLDHRLTLLAASGRPPDDALALEILSDQAGWARRWRIATQGVTTALLAINGGLLGWYAWHYTEGRTTAAVVAGLYGIGVPVVLWYDSLPWSEELALEAARTPAVTVAPLLVPSRGAVAMGAGISGSF